MEFMEMQIPVLKLVLAFMTFCVVILGGLVNLIEPHLPTFITQTFRYGKFAYTGPTDKNAIIRPIEVPKR
jgi:3-oxo-5-alpha-steroid 4-dehydrogenase 3